LGALKVTLVHGSPSQIQGALAKIPQTDVGKLEAAMRGAFDSGYSGVMIMMMLMSMAGVLIGAVLIRPERPAP
jgi:hypothetical protein